MDARAREASLAETRQFRVEVLRKVLTDLEDGPLDLIVIVQQPLGRRAGMRLGLARREPRPGQPLFHRIKASPGYERGRSADQARELVAGRGVSGDPADGIAVLQIGHDQPRPPTGKRSLSCVVGRVVCAGRDVVGKTSIGTLQCAIRYDATVP